MAKKQVIVYQSKEGIASVVNPAPTYSGTMEELLKDTVPDDCKDTADIVNVDTLPMDKDGNVCRVFRNAWDTEKGKSAEVNLTKAKEMAKDNVRKARTPKFQELDILYQRADEAGDADAKAAVVVKKQTARDATADTKITNADSVANLKTGMNEVITEVEGL